MQLSIITINYNNVNGLQKTIDSVLCQTWKDFEWIFIDGGSTDGSKELIEKTAAECPNVSYWCSEPDKGVYNAQNKGIAHANGEYLNFMNSGDTFYDENVLMNVWKEEHSEDMIYGDWIWCTQNGEKLIKSPREISMAIFQLGNICHQAMFLQTEMMKMNGFDESYKLFADWAYWMTMASDNRSFKYVPTTICRFEYGGLSCSNQGLADEELCRIRKIPNEPIQKVLLEYEITKRKLDRFEYFKFNDIALALMEERPLYRRLFRLSVGIILIIKKIIDRFLSLFSI